MNVVDWTPFDLSTGLVETHVKGSEVVGVAADVDVRLNRQEHSRRQRLGVGAELRRDVLDMLAAVPRRWVPESALRPGVFDLLLGVAQEAIEWRRAGRGDWRVRRLLQPPLVIDHVTVRASAWKSGLTRVDDVAGLSSRTLVLDRSPSDLEGARLEAMVYGFGLRIATAAGVTEIAEAEPFLPSAFTSATWRAAEMVYETGVSRGAF